MRPGKPLNLKLEPLSYDSLLLSYQVPTEMKDFPPGLLQKIEYSDEYHPGEWSLLEGVFDLNDYKVQINNKKQ